MVNPLIIVIPAIALAAAVILYILFPRFGPHYTSRLTCTKCGKTFDYNWVPGGSFSAVRLGQKRYLRCPNCHKWSTFNIWTTKIDTHEA
jgi:DNA-directed RNA polymerase subunit RPC12/RpoP